MPRSHSVVVWGSGHEAFIAEVRLTDAPPRRPALGYLGTTGLIAKTIFNVSAGIGTRITGGVKMNTITASAR